MLVSGMFAVFCVCPSDTEEYRPTPAGMAGLRHKLRHNLQGKRSALARLSELRKLSRPRPSSLPMTASTLSALKNFLENFGELKSGKSQFVTEKSTRKIPRIWQLKSIFAKHGWPEIRRAVSQPHLACGCWIEPLDLARFYDCPRHARDCPPKPTPMARARLETMTLSQRWATRLFLMDERLSRIVAYP
jgi:hypothetical protein